MKAKFVSRYNRCNIDLMITTVQQVAHTVNAIKSEMGVVTMLFHCCSIPSPRALLQDSPAIKNTIDLAIISHFWVTICLHYTYYTFKYYRQILFTVVGCSFTMHGGCSQRAYSTFVIRSWPFRCCHRCKQNSFDHCTVCGSRISWIVTNRVQTFKQ